LNRQMVVIDTSRMSCRGQGGFLAHRSYRGHVVHPGRSAARCSRPVGHRYGYRFEARDGGTWVTSHCDGSQILEQYRERITFPVV
jgi:hypothetical protein